MPFVTSTATQRNSTGIRGALRQNCYQKPFCRTRTRIATELLRGAYLERFISLGACWAFSLQPVLPSVYHPVVLLFSSGTRARPLTQSPELAFGLCLFSSWNGFDFFFVFRSTRLPPLSFGCCCAMVRTLPRSPTGDAAARRAFLRWRRSLASSRSFRRVRPASVPSAVDHSRCRTVPRCVAPPAPAGFADRGRPL